MTPEVQTGFDDRRNQIREAGEGELKLTRGDFRLSCTDRGTHPAREIAVLHLMYDPESLDIFEELANTADSPEEEAAFLALYDADRIGYSSQRSNKRGDATITPDPIERKDLGNELWRFRCPTCKRDLPITREKLADILDRLSRAGVSILDMSHLQAMISSN